jgi:hypothetical protein
MRTIFTFWLCLNAAYGQIPDKVYDSVRVNCMARDQFQLAASRSEFDDSYDVMPLTYTDAFERMNLEDGNLRHLLSETKKDDELASKVVRNLSRRKEDWDVRPVRIVATMLLLQKFDPGSIGKVCQAYEAAIASRQQQPRHEGDESLINLLKVEKYPCIFHIDGGLTYERLTIVEYLEKLQK